MGRIYLGFCLVLLGIVQHAAGKGYIEVHFLRYSDSCDEDWGTNKCDPMFTFCLSRPQSGSPSVSRSRCTYGRVGESGHYHNTNNVDFEHSTSIRGLKNPWVVEVSKFYDPRVMLVIRVRDADIFDDDHLRTWGKSLEEIVWPSKEETVWREDHMTSSDHTMRFRIRLYCGTNYYTHTCDKYCKAQDSDSGHYTCEPITGNKICMRGWQGENCDQDVNECDLSYCVRGQCRNFPGDYSCQCPANYQGKNCSEIMDACRSDPCQNGGICYRHSTLHEYTCNCVEGFEGTNCEMRSDPCDRRPCSNNGHCQSNEDRTDFSCKCIYPYKGSRCELISTTTTTTTSMSPSTTTSTTTTTTTSTTTTTPTTTFKSTSPPFKTSPPSNLIADNTSEGNPSSSNKERSTEKSTTEATIVGSESANVEKFSQKDDDDGFQPWYFAIIGALVLIVIIVLAFFLIKRRKKKSPGDNLSSPVVSFNNENLAFENNAYAEANRANDERDEQQPTSVRPLPTTPTDDDLFNPVKPTYAEVDETLGAVGGYAVPNSCSKSKTKSAESGKNEAATPFPSLSATEETEVKHNPYADFNTLTRNSQPLQVEPDTNDTDEEVHYHDLDEIAIAMQGETDTDGVEPSPPQEAATPSGTPPQDTPYNVPTNNQSYYATPPKREGEMDINDQVGMESTRPPIHDVSDDSSDDEGHGTMQEDLFQLRQSVKENIFSEA